MPLKIPSISTEYLRTEVESVVDPTVYPVDWAFVAPGVEPGALDWVIGTWDPGAAVATARCLVGPEGDVTLADGKYRVWLRITADPETPAISFDTLTVT